MHRSRFVLPIVAASMLVACRPKATPKKRKSRTVLYASHAEFGDRIVEYDVDTYTPLATLWMDQQIYGFQSLLDFQALPDGKLLVIADTVSELTNRRTQDRLYVLDPRHHKSIYLNEVPSSPSRLLPTRTGPFVLTHAIRYQNHMFYVSLLSPRTGRLICKAKIRGLPQDATGLVGGSIYVLGVVDKKDGVGSSVLHKLDPRTCALQQTLIQLEPMAQAIAQTKDLLFVAYAAPRHVPVRSRNTVVTYDVESGHEKGRIAVPDAPFNLHVYREQLLVVHFDPASRHGSRISIIDTRRIKLTKVLKARRIAPFGFCQQDSKRRLLVPQHRAGGFFELSPGPGTIRRRFFGPQKKYKDPPLIIRCREEG